MGLPEDNPADEQQPDRLEYAEAMAERYRQLLQDATPRWTADKPTVPGYYWLKLADLKLADWPHGQPVEIIMTGGHLAMLTLGNGQLWKLNDMTGSQWAGPILPPTEVPT